MVRRQRFWELCRSGQGHTKALQYLQTQVSQVVNHEDETESKNFRDLTGYLFMWHNFNNPNIETFSPIQGGMATISPIYSCESLDQDDKGCILK